MVKLIYFFIFLLISSFIVGTFSLYYHESIKNFHKFIDGEKYKAWTSQNPKLYQDALTNDQRNIKYLDILHDTFIISLILTICNIIILLIFRKDLIYFHEDKKLFIERIKGYIIKQESLNNQNITLENDKESHGGQGKEKDF